MRRRQDGVRRWIEKDAAGLLRSVGIVRGQTVLDFGCGSGNYTIPAAQVVGAEGRVYALDKESRGFWPSEGLDKLRRSIGPYRLQNVVVMKTAGELSVNLPDQCVDVVLPMILCTTTISPKSEAGDSCWMKFAGSLGPRDSSHSIQAIPRYRAT